ncbi:MAG: zinc-dependent metalloprotease, partial [Bacteroidota bacterium]
IKGHVSLGSLRVRQDFLLAQGLIEAYEEGRTPDPRLEEMALARLRQLSAHEVGHTLGLSHNYIASTLNRASVMDYPHPLIRFEGGAINLDDAYDTGIGAWDKRAILYGYQDFEAGMDVDQELADILAENEKKGQVFLSDAEARPLGSSHPDVHLWDNGASAAEELMRLNKLRQQAIEDFSVKSIPEGAPMATMEDVLVPVYFMHRYQAEATAKVIGGRRYRYQVRGDKQPGPEVVSLKEQQAAFDALMETLEPDFIGLPIELVEQIPPRPLGYARGREHFKIRTGFTLDPLGIAETSADMTLGLMLHPQRANRLVAFKAYDREAMGLIDLQNQLIERILVRRLGEDDRKNTPQTEAMRQVVEKALIKHFIYLALHEDAQPQTVAITRQNLRRLSSVVIPQRQAQAGGAEIEKRAHLTYCRDLIEQYFTNPQEIKLPETPALPDGSPIGLGMGSRCGDWH